MKYVAHSRGVNFKGRRAVRVRDIYETVAAENNLSPVVVERIYGYFMYLAAILALSSSSDGVHFDRPVRIMIPEIGTLRRSKYSHKKGIVLKIKSEFEKRMMQEGNLYRKTHQQGEP